MQLSAGDSQFDAGPSQHEYESVQDPKLSIEIPAAIQPESAGQQKVLVDEGAPEYRVTKDRYVGQLDLVTKLREG